MSEEQDQSQQVTGKESTSRGAQEQALPAYRSYWPFALAVALMVMLMGIITNPIVLAVGAVLTAAAVVGWGLERH